MNIILSQQDPNDPQVDIESERNRTSRQKQLFSSTARDIRAGEIATKRAARLDKYFSQHPPNGPRLTIYQDLLADFSNARWLTYEYLEASFDRLQRAGVLVVESTTDALGIKTFKSQVTALAMAKRRNVRPAEVNTLVAQLKENLPPLQLPRPSACAPRGSVHGCRYVPTINKWRVSLYFGGSQRALGCYLFETAIRLQDVLTFHFSPYRQSASYNTSAEHAAELLTQHPALTVFVTALEKHWLDTGVLCKPGVDKAAEWRQAIEARLTAIESTLVKIIP